MSCILEGIILTKLNRYAVATLITLGWLGSIDVAAGAVPRRIIESSSQTPQRYQAQIPTLPPPQDINSPTEGINIEVPDPFAPAPPLGYPAESPQRVPDTDFNEYILGIGDSIAVTVERFPDLNFSGTIDLQGNILVPLVGKVNILGRTPDQVQDQLATEFSEFVVNPEVTVVLAGLRPATVTIAGEVTRPGYYSLAPGSQLTAALQVAGGTTNLADLRTIIVRRRSPVNNSMIEQQIDLFTPLQNATALPDVRLRDGDSVVVLQLETGTTTDYDRNLASRSTLATPQITLRVLSYPNGRIGNLNLPNGSNFIDALTSLAPSLEEANLSAIALMRFEPEQGKVVTQHINGKALLLGDLAQNVPLQNEDVIVVGRSLIAKVNYALRFVTRPFSDFLGFRNFFENVGNVLDSGNDNNNDNSN